MRHTLSILLGLSFLLTVAACSTADSAPSSRAENIKWLESQVRQAPTPEQVDSLVVYYREDLADSTLRPSVRLDRLRFIAESLYSRNQHREAYGLLLDGITEFSEGAGVPQAALLLADIAINKRDEPQTAEVIFAQLRARFPDHAALNLIPDSYDTIPIEELQVNMQRAIYPEGRFDPAAALVYGKASLAYTALEEDAQKAFKDHLASGTILEDAGRLPLAKEHYTRASKRFAGSPEGGTAAFMKAFLVYELQQDSATGSGLLRAFIGEYPGHDMVDDAQAVLAGPSEK